MDDEYHQIGKTVDVLGREYDDAWIQMNLRRRCEINAANTVMAQAGVSDMPSPMKNNRQGNITPYIEPYLIPILHNIQYSLIFIAFLYGLVTQTRVYG